MRHKITHLLAAFLMLPAFSVHVAADNTTETVAQVSGTVTLSGEVDYVITDTDPFADGAVLDIVNTEKAVVILSRVTPSKAVAHLNHIRINGKAAVKNTNCMVKIYANGSIILPHGKDISPLTVYSGKGQTGESATFAAGSRQILDKHALNNRIQSFTLKRGYMVWLATKSSSTDPGYNRIFIADKEDLQVDLPAILCSSVSALRVTQWNDTGKKGCAGGGLDYATKLNTTWSYGWDAGINVWDDHEYVTIKQHKWWPSYSDVAGNGTSANALHFNEPDNTNDAAQTPATVAEALAQWPEMMATGLRIGSPAMASSWSWLYEFMDSIDARGWRCDFVAVHSYWYSDWPSWKSTLQGVKNRTGRPIWITEMNYGANWTGWPGSNTDGTAANYAIQLQHMGPILDGLESTPWIERYAYYNWVQDCRMLVDGSGKLTPTGEYYANIQSDLAYDPLYNVVPKLPKMKDPTGLTVRYDKDSHTATLDWKEYNGEYNAAITVERRMPGEVWQAVYDVPMKEGAASYTWKDTNSMSGYEYRIHVSDANGLSRYTRVQEAVIEHPEVGDAILVDGRLRYLGANLMIGGDFDLGTAGWTDGEGNPLSAENFEIISAGGVDGGPFLRAWSSETQMNNPGALKYVVDIQPDQDYYFAAAVLNDEYAFHRLSLTTDGTREDSLLAGLTVGPQWSAQTVCFHSGTTYSRALFSSRRMGGKSCIDKVALCPLYPTREEAFVSAIPVLQRRASYVLPLLEAHPDLHAELSSVLSTFSGSDEVAYDRLSFAVEGALQAVSDIHSIDSLAPYAEAAAALSLPGHEEVSQALQSARTATTAAAVSGALADLRRSLESYLPMIYAPDVITSPDFINLLNWEIKKGTYTEGSQRVTTVAGLRCWSALWTGVSASAGESQSMEIRQHLSDLSHGVYALECKATTDHACLSDQHGYMVAGGDTLVSPALSYDRLDIPMLADSARWETLVTPPVYLEDNSRLTIGFLGTKQGAVDNAWRDFSDLSAARDLREGWWCATDFTLRFCPMYRLSVPEGGWGVICLPRAFAVPAGVRIYQIAGLSKDYTRLCLAEADTVAAGVPYIYYSTEPELAFFEQGEAVSAASTVDNLRGNFKTAIKVPTGCYYLSGGAWHRATSTDRPAMADFSGILRRVQGLPVLSDWVGESVPIYGADEEMAKSILPVWADGATALPDGFYTVDGRRVESPVKGSVYVRVQNGKAEKVLY